MASTLKQLLAQLSIDHGLLRDFIRDPQQVMDAAGLTPAERAALVSRRQLRIQTALLEGRPPQEATP